VVHRSPRLLGLGRSRWWLDGLRQAVAGMGELSPGGVHRPLRRLKARYKRGRRYVHSPDPLDDSKMAAVDAAAAAALAHPDKCVFLHEDEFTYYRRPTAAQAYAAVGADDPRADQGHGNNSKRRVIASLDVRTGRLITRQRSSTGRDVLIRYFREVESHYPEAETVTIALDNWPVHFHEDVMTALAGTKVKLLRRPTYAPWTNPVEKVWRWLYATILHPHEFRDDWSGWKEKVTAWLGRWADGSLELLHYVGLNPG
jgi:transposase